jgi:hypothetical protein
MKFRKNWLMGHAFIQRDQVAESDAASRSADPGHAPGASKVDGNRREAVEICGAVSKRSGKACQVRIVGAGGRCYLHGGASTGPKTDAGREQSRKNALALNERRRAAKPVAAGQGVTSRVLSFVMGGEPAAERGARGDGHGVTRKDLTKPDETPRLQPELQQVMDRVGADQYARATAHMFAHGGAFNAKRKRPRFALT